jgi:hypothetical protein
MQILHLDEWIEVPDLVPACTICGKAPIVDEQTGTCTECYAYLVEMEDKFQLLEESRLERNLQPETRPSCQHECAYGSCSTCQTIYLETNEIPF